jgi:uncharacterized damage-inducible protein DinB
VAVRPNKQMQPTGRTVPRSARALIADGDQWNVGLFGRELEGPQLICNPLGRSRTALRWRVLAMTVELGRLEQQLRTAFEGAAWHGPAVRELLAGVTPEQAAARPIPGAHTIWELVLHLGGTYRLVLRRLRGDTRPLSPEEDWPAVPAISADTWREALDTLGELNAELRRAVAAFPAERLDEPLVSEPPYTAYAQFIGLTQHDLYHAGQIALLKRALAHRDPAA